MTAEVSGLKIYDGRNDLFAPETLRTITVVSADEVTVRSDLMVWRRTGRLDWSLFYCVCGCVHIDGVDMQAGEVWLYAPRVPQRYTLLAEENTVYGYVHFTGSDVENLLESLGIKTHMPIAVRASGFRDIFLHLCEDMREEDALSALRAEYHTLQLLSRLAVRRSDTSLPYRIQRATEVMEHAFAEPFDAAQYAAMLGVSVSRFNHLFRETVGVSPYAYYVRLRMENACGLLSDTTLSIGEIAHRCGYEDALYFTQVFRRQMGLPPTAYRKKVKGEQ